MPIVFGGLPGTGKTTLARTLAQERNATYLRIEQALRSSGMLAGEVGPSGYLVAYALAETSLTPGRTVVADCVNPVLATRSAWQRVAQNTRSTLIDIEVICSDRVEHRWRVETRSTDVSGLKLPSWDDVLRRDYEVWDRPRLVIDTAGRSVEETLVELRSRVGGSR